MKSSKMIRVSLLLQLWLGWWLVGVSLAVAEPALSERTYRELAKVHELMQQERFTQALQRLDRLAPKLKHDKFETAMLQQTYAYLYTSMQRYVLAIDAIQRSLASQVLPREATRNLLYLSAQLRVAEGDYSAALEDLTAWFEEQETPQTDAHRLAGVIHLNLQKPTKAIEHLEFALDLAKQPQEAPMRQLMAAYVQAGRLRDAATLLQQIILRWGNRSEDWRQLAALYRELGDDRMALAVLVLAKRRGLLPDETDLLNLARYYLYLDLPYEAARLLATALQNKQLTSTPENWELLGDAWSRARETTKAIESLARAASLTNDPELHLKRARLAAAREDWQGVLQAVQAAMQIGTENNRGEAYLLAGIAHHHLDDEGSARAAFLQAQAESNTREQAQQWLVWLAQLQR
jgi:hypothetical protein